ncbi:MAG: hypothetical protein OEM65_08405 [Desulfuromonadales bacterium]|jgi:hypothetical protein|nr:hypothetical protein [Desulfuromonadales bacterium]HKJ29017.1 hypothetical protein [Desulfuromonadales bacterium]
MGIADKLGHWLMVVMIFIASVTRLSSPNGTALQAINGMGKRLVNNPAGLN